MTWKAHVTGGVPTYTYEWSVKEEGDATWTIVGENSFTWVWTPTTGDVGRYDLRCKVSDAKGGRGEVLWKGFEVST